MFPIDQVVIDGNRVIFPINITPAQTDKFCNAATRSQQDGKQNTPRVIQRLRFQKLYKRVLLFQSQCLALRTFVIICLLNFPQSALCRIFTDVVIVHRNLQDLPQYVVNRLQRVNCHRLANIATPCQVIIKTEDCRFANIFDFHFPDFGADEVVIHIQVINVGGLLQTDLVLFPKIVHVIQTQIASGAADTITLIAVDFRFLLTQFA